MLSIGFWISHLSKNLSILGCQRLQINRVYLVLRHLDENCPYESKEKKLQLSRAAGMKLTSFGSPGEKLYPQAEKRPVGLGEK